MPRHAVVKQLWAYIKSNNLQNESNKRQVSPPFPFLAARKLPRILTHLLPFSLTQILCDAKLTDIFGKEAVE